jgi:hypothetical protein
MTTITTSQTVTSANNPYTLAAGNTIVLDQTSPFSGRSGEAIYTSYSSSTPTNMTGGATIVIDGVIIDDSIQANANEYAVQSEAVQDATIVNAGIILAPNMFAIGINDGLVYNSLNSTISGFGGIKVGTGNYGTTIVNQGIILGSQAEAIDFLITGSNKAQILNESNGYIRGGTIGGVTAETGILMQGGTITNAGSILQGGTAGDSIDFFGTQGHDTLILDPGQFLQGLATASGAGNYIILGGTGLGTLASPGNYKGFTLMSVAAGSDWQIGTQGVGVSIAGVSTINVAGTLDVLGTIVNTDFNMSGTGGLIDFSAPLYTTNASPAGLNGNTLGTITDFGLGDTFIVGPTVLVTQPSDNIITDYNTATGVLQIIDATRVNDPGVDANDYVNITVSGTGGAGLTLDNFSITSGPGGFTVTEIPCFSAGTGILTPSGRTLVEELAAGDIVLTARDGSAQEIVWVGQRSIDLTRHADPEKVIPVRIIAGAFEPGLPERDLVVSPDHALFLDGCLIEAKTLVNGTTIIRDKSRRTVTYHHIELARHDVVLAEGMPAETYLDGGNRNMFEGGAAEVLHPDFATDRDAGGCATLMLDGPQVLAVRQRLLERAVALGFELTGDIDAVVNAGGKRIAPSVNGNALRFELPAGCDAAMLLSSTGVPAETGAEPGDRRVLGLAVIGLAIIDEAGRREIAIDDAGHAGFHDAEGTHRWTAGAAKIALPAYRGAATLEITTSGQATRWRAARGARAVA